MSKFLNDFKYIIRNCLYTNTYKMAWAKAIVELSNNYDVNKSFVEITLKQISEPMIKYYWNQTIYFNLYQGSNLTTIPILVQLVKELITIYRNYTGDNNPIMFEKAKVVFDEHLSAQYEEIINRFSNTLKADVSYRFLKINKKQYDVYSYKKGDNSILIKSKDLMELNENQDDLFDLINYRWSLMLESFNSCPRINKKVRINDEEPIKRSSLTRFDEYLNYENGDHKCFICGKPIKEDELSRDHVIPWSYLYSDDIWNIVYVHKSCNSSKSNIIPSKKDIEKLKQRNLNLQKKLKENNISNKTTDELDLAIDKDYVDQFYIGCKS